MISVILVTFNRAERLKDSIQDVLNQSFPAFELIICDDASTDDTESVCRAFAAQDSRILYHRQPKNVGMPHNLKSGIQLSRHQFIAILHDGDRFDKQLLEHWYRGMQTGPNIGFVFNAMGTVDANMKLASYFMEFEEGIISGRRLLEQVFFRRWHFDSPVYGEAMVRKSALENAGNPDARFGFYADVDLWMRLLHQYDAYYCKNILINRPEKTAVPRLFEDSMVRTYFLMRKMHFENRIRHFKKSPLRLALEMPRFAWYSWKNILYILLIHIKNHNLSGYLNLQKEIAGKSALFFSFWLVLLPVKLLIPMRLHFSINPGK